MSREYAPLGHSIFSPPGEVNDNFDDYTAYTSGHFQSPEIHLEPQRPDNIPLITSHRQSYKRENSNNYTSLSPEGPDVQERNVFSPVFGEQSSNVRRKPVHSTSSRSSLRKSFFSTGDLHKNAADLQHPYAKQYNFRRTRDKLFSRGFKQWLITAFLAAGVAAALAGYETLTTITPDQKHVFNALITGISICLGMNLASSLRAYAELMRWRVMACTWLSLKELDLILGCGSLRKIVELFFAATKRKRFPWMSWIQFLCLVWLFVNLAAQVLVAMIGLTYSLDNSPTPYVMPGNVSIADLSKISDIHENGAGTDQQSQRFSAHVYGLQGQDYPYDVVSDPLKMSIGNFEKLYVNEDYSTFLYRFVDRNPTDRTVQTTSIRTITAKATCTAYNPTSYDVPTLGNETLPGTLAFYNDSTGTQSLYIHDWTYGATTWLGEDAFGKDVCGKRCTRVFAFQAGQAADPSHPHTPLKVDKNTIFECHNTISDITNLTPDGRKYQLPDREAKYIAGAIGWTGYWNNLGNGVTGSVQDILYSNDSYWSPDFDMTTNPPGPTNAALFVAQFSIAALAAMDQNGPHVNISDGLQPQRALMVTVEWRFTIPLLAAIVTVQMVALLLVILWANKAIIKDESFLAITKLLAPTVQKLGDHGSVLTGEEVADQITYRMGGDYKVFYGCRQLAGGGGGGGGDGGDEESVLTMPGGGSLSRGGLLRADIIEKGQGMGPTMKRAFLDGRYD